MTTEARRREVLTFFEKRFFISKQYMALHVYRLCRAYTIWERNVGLIACLSSHWPVPEGDDEEVGVEQLNGVWHMQGL